MTTLRLLIPETWPETLRAAWALVGPDGRLLQQGESEPRHWPAADACEVILAGPQTLLLKARLPKAPRRERDRLVAYALEEKLAQDTDQLHFTVVHQQGDDAAVVVVARDRLRRVLAALQSAGRPADAVRSELDALPADDGWTLAIARDRILLRQGPWSGLAWDREGGEGGDLRWLVGRAADGQADGSPRITLRPAPDAGAVDAAAWQGAGGVSATAGAAYRWHEAGGAANLLHGDFAPARRHGAGIARFKPALWLAGAALALDLVAGVAHAAWLRHRYAGLEAQTEALFAATFPGAAVVDPGLQMRRQLNELRGRQGQLRDDDLLALLAELSAVLGAGAQNAMQSLQYDDGRLEATLDLPPDQDPEALRQLLGARGVDAVAKEGGPGRRIVLVLRRGDGL